MDIHTASNFLAIRDEDGNGRYYMHTIKALDLQTTVASNLNSGDDCASQYLDVSGNEKLQLPFEEDDYLNFIDFGLEDFHKIYEKILFQKLKNKSGKSSTKGIDFFDKLLKIDPDIDTEVILSKFLSLQIETLRCSEEERGFEIFENVSGILYKKNYNNPKLSLLLITAVSNNYYLLCDILSNTYPPDRLDYVLHNMKKYCIENLCIDVFLEFKRKNSILSCLETGRKDLLEILLKYGSWSDYSTIDSYEEWMFHCHSTMIEDSLIIEEFLKQQRYDLKQYLLIRECCKAFFVPLNKLSPYIAAIQLVWRSVPYPYLSTEEIEFVLTLTTPPKKRSKVRRACELYRQILCPGQLEPRSLKHFTRCVIRSTLDQKALLPEGIGCLNIPENLCSYLRLEH